MPFQTRFLVAFTVVATVLFSTAGQQHALAQFGDDLGLGTVNDEPCDPVPAIAEDDAEPQPALVYIDPAQFVPEALSRPIDLDVTDVTLAEAMQRISEATGLPVRIDEEELQNEGVNADEVVSDRAENEPAYLLLDRMLENVGGVELAWFVDHGLLYVTTKLVADDKMATVTHNVRDLFERHISGEQLEEIITNMTAGPWFDLDGVGGTLEFFRDILVVRQSHRMQREVAALLEAIRQPGWERRSGEPASHAELEQKLDETVAVEWTKTPLGEVVQQLNRDYALRLRVDAEELENVGVTTAEAVSFPAVELPLRTVLHILLENVAGVELTAMLHKGRTQITTKLIADNRMSTVIYDVGDLTLHSECRMELLMDVVMNQTWGPWFDTDGVGGNIESVGNLMFVRHAARVHAEISSLLASLRFGMDESRENGWEADIDTRLDAQVETHYYHVDTDAADDLVTKIPELVAPGTWASTVNADGDEVELAADAVGTLDRMAGGRRVIAVTNDGRIFNSGSHEKTDAGEKGPRQAAAVVIPRTILIITHRRSVHRELVTTMDKIEFPGSTWSSDRDIGFGFYGGSDEFYQGGGFFSVGE